MRGDRVKVKGKPGIHIVTYAMLIPTPCIIDHQFAMKEIEMYKFISNVETFYAYGSDLQKVVK